MQRSTKRLPTPGKTLLRMVVACPDPSGATAAARSPMSSSHRLSIGGPAQAVRLDYDPSKGVHVNKEDFTRPVGQQKVVHQVRLPMDPTDAAARTAWLKILEGRMQLYWNKWTSRYDKPPEILEAEQDVDRRRRGQWMPWRVPRTAIRVVSGAGMVRYGKEAAMIELTEQQMQALENPEATPPRS